MYPDFLSSKIFYKGSLLSKPNHLYKYFKPDANSLDSLKNHYLYFSNPKDFGDEYDCLISDDILINQLLKDSEEFKKNLVYVVFQQYQIMIDSGIIMLEDLKAL